MTTTTQLKPSRTGARVLVETLEHLGVEYVFGYPGGASLPLFDALCDSKIKFVLSRHEQGATHMADGYARASGKPGVVLVTSGPGATNTVTGIYTAQMDSVPLLVITGQVARSMIGKDAFQEVDILSVTLPLVKHSYLVNDPNEMALRVREAFLIATTGRPGPVLLDIPKDVGTAVCDDFAVAENKSHLPGYTAHANLFDQDAIDEVMDLFQAAKRPLLLIGRGAVISRAGDVLKQFAERLRVPVTNTLLGKGAFPETHPLSLGMLGMHGTAYANKAVTECDLICSIGSRFDDRIVGTYETFCKNAKKIHIDIDPAEVGKLVRPDASLIGDARLALEELLEHAAPLATDQWLAQLENYKTAYPIVADTSEYLTAKHVLQELFNQTGGNATITTDVGQHQMWAAQVYRVARANSWLSSGGAGTMGFGFPAAIGAQLAQPKNTVVAVVGDGGFQMTLAELSTAVLLKLPVKIIVVDNKYLGMVRQWQEMFFGNRLSGVDLTGNPNFAPLAEAYGAKGFRLDSLADLASVMREFLAHQSGPAVLHAEVAKEENVFPMIPAGQALTEMLVGPTTLAQNTSQKGDF